MYPVAAIISSEEERSPLQVTESAFHHWMMPRWVIQGVFRWPRSFSNRSTLKGTAISYVKFAQKSNDRSGTADHLKYFWKGQLLISFLSGRWTPFLYHSSSFELCVQYLPFKCILLCIILSNKHGVDASEFLNAPNRGKTPFFHSIFEARPSNIFCWLLGSQNVCII